MLNWSEESGLITLEFEETFSNKTDAKEGS